MSRKRVSVTRHTISQPLDLPYRLIPLTKGQNAIVDAEDFEWLSNWNWCATWRPDRGKFYAVTRTPRTTEGKQRTVYMHRFILGCIENELGDHKNANTLDNRRGNLRKCDHAGNSRNRRYTGNLTGYKGVCNMNRRWATYIVVHGESIYVGGFNSPIEAAHAYDEAAKKFHGEFANLNFPS